ncbi:MAG TPA: hypothetical protein VIM69_05150 [Opitutaceae bacterium]
MSAPLETTPLSLQVTFGGAGALVATKTAATFPVEVPVLAGFPEESIFPPVTIEREEANCALFRSGELLIGCIGDTIATSDLEACTRRLYQRVLSAASGLHFYRIWNYVPRINALVNGLEHYRAFCRARSVVFENVFGADYKQQLSAASAVGCGGDRLAIIFVAGRSKPMHLENPEQVPAYEYPVEHGPRPPSFSRGTVVTADGRDYVFISGTSAIKGHATVAPGSLEEQIACTMDNLKLVSMASGVGEDLGHSLKTSGKAPWTRHFKIYLRKAEDLLTARRLLEGPLLQPSDRVTWLRSDVCRAALNIEIEATLVRS